MTYHNKKINFAGTATVGPKGQIVIPSELRDKLDIKTGDKMIALEIEGHRSVTFITSDQIQEMIDALNNKTGLLRDMQIAVNGEDEDAS